VKLVESIWLYSTYTSPLSEGLLSIISTPPPYYFFIGDWVLYPVPMLAGALTYFKHKVGYYAFHVFALCLPLDWLQHHSLTMSFKPITDILIVLICVRLIFFLQKQNVMSSFNIEKFKPILLYVLAALSFLAVRELLPMMLW